MIARLFQKYTIHFSRFYGVLRYRLFVGIGISLFVGVLDGIGLAMFMPLLEIFDTERSAGEASSVFNAVNAVFDALGLPLTLATILLLILLIFVVKGAFKFAEGYYAMLIQQIFILHIRKLGVKRLTNYRYSSFVHADGGRIQNTLSGEAGRVITGYSHFFAAIQNGVMVTIYLALAFAFNSQFTLFVLVGGLLTNFIFSAIYKKTKQQSIILTQKNHSYQGLLIQTVHYFKYLKATASFGVFRAKLDEGVDRIEDANRRLGVLRATLMAVREPLIFGIITLVIYVQIIAYEQPIGLVLLSLVFFYRALSFLMLLQSSWNGFIGMTGSLTNMYAFLEELAANADSEEGEAIDRVTSDIELIDLGFTYADGNALFDKLTLTFKYRETTAVIGESGSGKTTLINVVSGLLSPSSGDVRVNGMSYDRLQKSSLQHRIGYITQEPVVFDDTLFNNVTFWADKTPEHIARFERVLKQAALDEFVQTLPDKEDTALGNNGILISGGQRQRLSIARELFRDIDILIMDEATSALDSETERAIQSNISALKGLYTIIIVAHRLSTIKDADNIVLLNAGNIDGMGSFDVLKEKNRMFRRMVELQEL